MTGDCDPSIRPIFGIDRQGPAIKSLETNFWDMHEIMMLPGVGHTPPEESPEQINTIILKFLRDIGYSPGRRV